MKTLNLTVPVNNNKDMNDLVDTICKITNQDSRILRDKFKMLDKADDKKLIDLCRHLNLDVNFCFSEKEKKQKVTVKVIVGEKFDISSLTNKEETKKPKINKIPGNNVEFESVNDTEEDEDPFS